MPFQSLIDDDEGVRRLCYDVNALALRYYQGLLTQSETVTRYAEGRGLSVNTLKVFGAGYAPLEWEGLGNALTAQGVTKAQAERVGLVGYSKRGTYDRLRGRLVLPIKDLQGRTLGFSGRLLIEDKDAPKYWNTPETPVFAKGKALLGLNQAWGAFRRLRCVLLAEGTLDVPALHGQGFRTAVAPLGTSLTHWQADIIADVKQPVYLLFDADDAGDKAASRSAVILADAGTRDIYRVNLPPGEDPASLLAVEGGKERLRGLLKEGGRYSSAEINSIRAEAGRGH